MLRWHIILQDKYPNVNTIAKDSCFHFGYMKQKVDDKTGEDLDEDDRYEKKHFDFRLNGDIDGVDRQDDVWIVIVLNLATLLMLILEMS